TDIGCQRAQIDDSTLPLFRHLPGCCLCAEKSALEIGGNDPLPKSLIDIQGGADFFITGIVDQDVEPAHSLCRRLDGLSACGDIPHIEREAPGSSACSCHAFRSLFERGGVARRHRNLCPSGGKRLGNGLPDASACARDQCLAAFKGEKSCCVHSNSV